MPNFTTFTQLYSPYIYCKVINPVEIIDFYYQDNQELRELLMRHSNQVAVKALAVADRHPELNLDRTFLYEGAMLHDIGIFKTDAPSIYCHGSEPYICHGYLGALLLEDYGAKNNIDLTRHARVACRHTGTGLTKEQIIRENLMLPHCDFIPETAEEKVVCFADKFFSKSKPEFEKTVPQALHSLEKFGEETVSRFNKWLEIFL